MNFVVVFFLCCLSELSHRQQYKSLVSSLCPIVKGDLFLDTYFYITPSLFLCHLDFVARFLPAVYIIIDSTYLLCLLLDCLPCLVCVCSSYVTSCDEVCELYFCTPPCHVKTHQRFDKISPQRSLLGRDDNLG